MKGDRWSFEAGAKLRSHTTERLQASSRGIEGVATRRLCAHELVRVRASTLQRLPNRLELAPTRGSAARGLSGGVAGCAPGGG